MVKLFSKQFATRGFSLVELLVVLAIIAIVMAIAVPSYRDSIESNRITSVANNLLGAIQFARSEAVMRRERIIVCPSAGDDVCNGGNWSAGGIVLGSEGVIRNIQPAPDVRIDGGIVEFTSDGRNAAALWGHRTQITVGHELGPHKKIVVPMVGYARFYE